ncbi:hypothetical protein CARUB_v10021818mg [Capsella rubella]|uniref:NAC domain-containing protein n=1 Tax=Capsella rubella TaxID=81985 RepID=R0HTX8_9BRAS|nr:NAC domain-containing protein 43 [Capsella rubella]EOA33319.1 hypothetical protein CARUB_v10021818mg [Capsella rubella]
MDDELIIAEDDVLVSRYLKPMVVNGDSWHQHFIKDEDVFNKNPSEDFDTGSPTFVIVKPRTENYGKTDGCKSGCWRIIGRDKLIKSEKTGEVLGFKKILKFCVQKKPRGYKRSWLMEEFRLTDNLNKKQDHVICKIRLLFEAETSSLLAKHFSYLPTTKAVPVPATIILPAYGYESPDPQMDDESYVLMIPDSEGNTWPSYVTNDLYRLNPWKLVNLYDPKFFRLGTCFFTNGTCGVTDVCDGGYWRILHPDRLVRSKSGEPIGFKKVFQYYETKKHRYFCEGEEIQDRKVTWTIEEYRRAEIAMQNKVLCVIKFTFEDN